MLGNGYSMHISQLEELAQGVEVSAVQEALRNSRWR
jgi:hypothetical protein